MNATFSYLLALVVWLLLPQTIFSQTFTFDPAPSWECLETGIYRVQGDHAQMDQDEVWLFLQDRHSHLYMQYPPIDLLMPKRWKMSNLRIGNDITYIWAVTVNDKGKKTLLKWKDKSRWGAISADEVKALGGYKRISVAEVKNLSPFSVLAQAVDQTAPVDTPIPNTTIYPSLSDAVLTLADFEIQSPGKGYPLGGGISSWQSDKDFQVRLDTITLSDEAEQFGRYALSIKHSKRTGAKINGWKGGGLVLHLQAKGAPIDLSAYSFLEFDMQAGSTHKLESLAIKLEDSKTNAGAELPLKQHGATFSTTWEHIRIPLSAFNDMKSSYPGHWKKVNLNQITKIVFVGVINEDKPHFSGQLLIDNVLLRKQ